MYTPGPIPRRTRLNIIQHRHPRQQLALLTLDHFPRRRQQLAPRACQPERDDQPAQHANHRPPFYPAGINVIVVREQEQRLTRLVNVYSARQVGMDMLDRVEGMPHPEILFECRLIHMLRRVDPRLFLWIYGVHLGRVSCAGGAHCVQEDRLGEIRVAWGQGHACFECLVVECAGDGRDVGKEDFDAGKEFSVRLAYVAGKSSAGGTHM